jgi:hypothetical protein
MNTRTRLSAALLLAVTLAPRALGSDAPPPGMIDLTQASVAPALRVSGPPPAAMRTLVEEVAARTRSRWPVALALPREARDVIVVGRAVDLKSWAGPPFHDPLARALTERPPPGPEGYSILTDKARRTVVVAGHDDRGVLFGVGRLLRELRIGPDHVWLPEGFQVRSTPKLVLRGHQLGYRPKTNSYDAWDVPRWEQYIRDLAVFGTNAVELVPPRTDDDRDSPHFPRPPMEMMEAMSRICAEHDLDVWVWFPVMDPVDADPAKAEPLLKEWDEVFRKLPRLDAVFVPGGDPGHIAPGPLFAFLEKATEVLHRSHPKAAVWVSPQGFDARRVDEFLSLVKAEPKWLGGVGFGPKVRVPLAELWKVLPAKYPIRGYPDITHSRQCQHPVPDWDIALAVTEGREAINPRPLAMARLVKAYAPHTIGFLRSFARVICTPEA